MSMPRNLSPGEWADVLLKDRRPTNVAFEIREGKHLPWTRTLLNLSQDCETVLDLGSGSGEHAAALAARGRESTLVDWSLENLRFGKSLFTALDISGRFCQADMTKPLPFKSDAFDLVFSCGVFEYFTPLVRKNILSEAYRVAAKKVVILIPNAASVPYRLGKWYMEKKGTWYWGGEVPAYTLKGELRNAGFDGVREFTVAAGHSARFLTMPLPRIIRSSCNRLSKLLDQPEASRLRQGYLLVAVGEKNT